MPAYPSRSKQAFRRNLVRAGVWAFLIAFVLSVVGVAIVTVRAH